MFNALTVWHCTCQLYFYSDIWLVLLFFSFLFVFFSDWKKLISLIHDWHVDVCCLTLYNLWLHDVCCFSWNTICNLFLSDLNLFVIILSIITHLISVIYKDCLQHWSRNDTVFIRHDFLQFLSRFPLFQFQILP